MYFTMSPTEQAESFAGYYKNLTIQFPDAQEWQRGLTAARLWQIAISTSDMVAGYNLLAGLEKDDLGVVWRQMAVAVKGWLDSL